MSSSPSNPRLRVVIAGGGIAALETVLALHDLAAERTAVTVIAPNSEFINRPMTVREPFSYPQARHYPLGEIVAEAGAELVADELAYVDPAKHIAHLAGGGEVEYDALVLALGARASTRFKHALTIDDGALDETLHGLIQDLEGGYIQNLAFVAPGRMAWPLPLYEIAMMTSGRAYDMNIELASTLVTPEDSPLAIFGAAASKAVAVRLAAARIQTITSAYAEVPRTGEVVINPGDRHLSVDRVIALPELYGPCVRGIPLSEHGFIRVNPHGQVMELDDVYAAGDATEFAVKHGGVGSQQADAVAESIAARAGAPITPEPFQPVIRGMLLTDGEPIYLTARITGGQGFSSEVTDAATWSPPGKLAAKYLSPCLDRRDHERTGSAT
jgi:sulfide:quinone oxidoreductase